MVRLAYAINSPFHDDIGILPHNGQNIRFTDVTDAVCANYNFSQTFSVVLSNSGADTLHRNYFKDKFNLHELSLHNIIEHDASLTRMSYLAHFVLIYS